MAEVGVDIGWADSDPDVVVGVVAAVVSDRDPDGAGVASGLPATGISLPEKSLIKCLIQDRERNQHTFEFHDVSEGSVDRGVGPSPPAILQVAVAMTPDVSFYSLGLVAVSHQ